MLRPENCPVVAGLYALSEINSLNREDFVRILGPVFEDSPWIAETAWQQLPFANRSSLHQALCHIVADAGQDRQLALIRAHPDLVGRAALAGTLTQASSAEQASAGLNQLSSDEIAAFQRYNRKYHERFGFPFVICARLNKKEAILNGFARRLMNEREQEIRTALQEIFKIADLRLRDLVTEN